MNAAFSFLTENQLALGLGQHLDLNRLSCVVLTPRFRASRHVLFFFFAEASPHPALVAKISRLPGSGDGLALEAENLRSVQALRAEGFGSIPRVIAFGERSGHAILVESGLRGRPMKPTFVRRHPDACAEAGLTWLIGLHLASAAMAAPEDDWFGRLIESPLDCFEPTVRPTPDEARLLHQTKSRVSPLRHSPMALVFEHGDFSSPNVLMTDEGRVGVVDWELAEPRGTPATDLFFFLTYIAFARRNATRVDEQVRAFREAFFGSAAWARPYVARYAERLGLSSQLMRPLFVLCWCRYVARLLVRVTGEASGLETDQAAAWLRQNRYFALWREAVERYDELSLT